MMGMTWWYNCKGGSILVLIIFWISSFINSCSSFNFQDHQPADDHHHGARYELIHLHSLRMRHRNFVIKGKLERLKDLVERDGIRQQAILHRLLWSRRQQNINHATNTNYYLRPPETSHHHVVMTSKGMPMNMMMSNRFHDHQDHTSSSTTTTSSGRHVSIEMPLRSGADYGAGQYFVTLKAGTPSQKFLVIADTGSDLTWINCRHRCGGGRHRRTPRHRRVFCADHSSSFTTFPCSSTMCKIDLMNLFSLARCPTPFTPCAYDYRYSDGSAAIGLFGNETITVQLRNGRKAKVENVVVGCSETARGPTVQLADGVLGMGYSNYSFAVRAAHKFGGKFSYCLVDHLSPKTVSNYLVFGKATSSSNYDNYTQMQHTQLILGVMGPLYAVNVKGISLGGVMLNNIPDAVWEININGTTVGVGGGGGTIIDSGSSLTFLTRPAYQAVMDALKPSLSKFNQLQVEIGPLEYCFNSTGFEDHSSLVPRLEFHFVDGARFRPPVKNYVIDAADGVKCIGILAADWPGGTNVIGNIMQQNHIWEFDLINHRLGFSASTCTT